MDQTVKEATVTAPEFKVDKEKEQQQQQLAVALVAAAVILPVAGFTAGRSYGENKMTRGKAAKRFFRGPNKYWPKRSKKRWF